MLAAFQRNTGTLITVRDFDDQISGGTRVFYLVGAIEGLIQCDYTVDYTIDVHDVVNDLPDTLPKISGYYAGISVREGIFEYGASDISAREELYYTTTPSEFIISTDFFELAKARGQLEYDESEVRHFIKSGYCHKGKTTFKEICRLPPGEVLQNAGEGRFSTGNYLKRFAGALVTDDTFKNALSHSVKSEIQRNPTLDEVVAYSGGVDSSVLLALVRSLKDVTAITFRFIPALSWNEPDAARSEEMTKKFDVQHEFVDVDLNEIGLGYLDDVILSMPFTAHLSINFKKMFETLRTGKKRLWSGQDFDTLYCYNATYKLWLLQRFLLSDTYDRMLQGVEGSQRYRFVKPMLDVPLKWSCSRIYKEEFETPHSIEELIDYFIDSERVLALKVIDKQDGDQKSIPASADINSSTIRQKLFDEITMDIQSGVYHKVQLQAKKLFNIETVFAYSTPGMVHLFRNRNLTLTDVLFPKHFLHRYARELGVPKSGLEMSSRRIRKRVAKDWETILRSTQFGTELRNKSRDVATQIDFPLNISDRSSVQKDIGLSWINKVREELAQMNVDLNLPKLT